MRGWIMGGHGTCAVHRPADDLLELRHRPLAVVVDDRVVKLGREGRLLLRDVEPLVDLALALGRPQAQAALPLLAARRGDEDRDRRGDAVANRECAAGLDLEHRRLPLSRDALELGPERPRAVALTPGELDPLEEVALLQPAVELLVREEPVVAAVLLAGPHRPRRPGDRERELGDALHQKLGQRALALTGSSGEDENGPISG